MKWNVIILRSTTNTGILYIFLIITTQVNSRNIDGATPICDAASSGHSDIVKLLIENGACVNPVLLLSSPLHEAALRGKTVTIDFFIRNKKGLKGILKRMIMIT